MTAAAPPLRLHCQDCVEGMEHLQPGSCPYAEWIAEFQRDNDLRGKCLEACHTMQAFFPELELVWGWVRCERHPTWPHWYLRTPSGEVVDPSSSQFAEIDAYGEWDPDVEVYGLCPDCNELICPPGPCGCG